MDEMDWFLLIGAVVAIGYYAGLFDSSSSSSSDETPTPGGSGRFLGYTAAQLAAIPSSVLKTLSDADWISFQNANSVGMDLPADLDPARPNLNGQEQPAPDIDVD